MPHLLRVSCGPGWTVSERGLWGWLCTSGTITSVCWSVNTQGNQASSSSSASFSSHEGEAHFCLMDQRGLMKILSMLPGAWHEELFLLFHDTQKHHCSHWRWSIGHYVSCIKITLKEESGSGEGESHILIHRLAFIISISFFFSLSHSKPLSPIWVSQGTRNLRKVSV